MSDGGLSGLPVSHAITVSREKSASCRPSSPGERAADGGFRERCGVGASDGYFGERKFLAYERAVGRILAIQHCHAVEGCASFGVLHDAADDPAQFLVRVRSDQQVGVQAELGCRWVCACQRQAKRGAQVARQRICGCVSIWVAGLAKQDGAPANLGESLNERCLRRRQPAYAEEYDGAEVVQSISASASHRISGGFREVFVVVEFFNALAVHAIKGNSLGTQAALHGEAVERVFGGVAQLPECAAQAQVCGWVVAQRLQHARGF